MVLDGLDHLATAVSVIGDGDREPAIVLPGGPCRDPEYLADLAGIGDSRPLIVMHPRGTVSSGGLSRGWWTDAQDVGNLTRALGLDSVDVIAHSAGTRLALAAATQYPGLVRSMLLITPPASWLSMSESDSAALAESQGDPFIAEAFRSMLVDEPTSEREFQDSLRRHAPAGYAKWGDREKAHAKVGAMNWEAATTWFNDIPADVVARIAAADLPPTLVIGGDQDLLTGVQPVREYAEVVGAEVAFIRECGHYPWIEQPEAFAALAGRWLSGRGAAAQ